MAAYRRALRERTGFDCQVALVIVSTEETTQGIFIDTDQLDLYDARFIKRANMFHEKEDDNEDEDSSQQGLHQQDEPQKVASGWLNIHETLEWLQGWVGAGYGWCATHFADRYRLSDNCRGSNIIVLDIDGDMTLEEFWSAPTAQQWCCYLHQ